MTKATSVKLSDGTTAYVLSQQHLEVLIDIAERDMWWSGFRKRTSAMSKYASIGAGVLVTLSLWWPWLQKTVTFLLQGIPT